MRHYLAQLRMLISDLKTCLSEVKDDKLPNEWLLVSDIKMIVNTGSLEFKKELSSDDDLLNIFQILKKIRNVKRWKLIRYYSVGAELEDFTLSIYQFRKIISK